jgi:hypothetical protein
MPAAWAALGRAGFSGPPLGTKQPSDSSYLPLKKGLWHRAPSTQTGGPDS